MRCVRSCKWCRYRRVSCQLVLKSGSHVGSNRIIVIMLFRLRMTVDHAIKAYTRLSKDIFSRKVLFSQMRTNASLLEHGITRIIHLTLGVDESQAQKINMEDDRAPKWRVVQLQFKISTDNFIVSLVP